MLRVAVVYILSLVLNGGLAHAKPVYSTRGFSDILRSELDFFYTTMERPDKDLEIEEPQGVAFALNTGKANVGLSTTPVEVRDVQKWTIGYRIVGVGINRANLLPAISLETLSKIFSCQIRDWRDVPGSKISGEIEVIGRNADSLTMQTLRHVWKTAFGSCVKVLDMEAAGQAVGESQRAIGLFGSKEVYIQKASYIPWRNTDFALLYEFGGFFNAEDDRRQTWAPIRAVAIDVGGQKVALQAKEIVDGRYPLVMPMEMYVKPNVELSKNERQVVEFFNGGEQHVKALRRIGLFGTLRRER